MTGTRTASSLRETHDAPALVYTREPLNFKPKTCWTWSVPGPMASLQHAERIEVVSTTLEFDDDEFQGFWRPGECWDWE